MEIILTREDVIKLIVTEKEIEKLLLGIQSEWRIKRGLGKDEGDQLLHAADCIDSIIDKLKSLKPDLESYDSVINEIEKQESEQKIEDPYERYEKLNDQ